MKLKILLTWLCSAALAWAGTNDITSLVQKGLFEEEANHHLDAAIEYYQEAIGKFDKDRQLTATAIFRLGECYRLQGRTNEANAQYQRILQDFPDQKELADLSKSYLPKNGGHSSFQTQLVKIGTGSHESAAESEEIQRIKDMLQNSPDLINTTGPFEEQTPLIKAIRAGWMSAVKLLLESGAVINPEPGQNTPLSEAANEGNKGMIELLISKGAKLNQFGTDRRTPLDLAVLHAYKTAAESLLTHGADVNAPNGDQDRPLHTAAAQGFISMAELLLAHKAEVDALGNHGQTPLFRAVQHGRKEMIQFLVSNHANINAKDEAGVTPLHEAIRDGKDASFIQLLLDNGADVNLADQDGDSPLFYAVNRLSPDLVKLLIEHHADVNALNKNGSPPLAELPHHRGPWNEQSGPAIRNMLVQAGASEDYKRPRGIFVSQKGSGSIGLEAFSIGTNSNNRYTLFDAIGLAYGRGFGVSFPDFAHLVIDRLTTSGAKEVIPVNLEDILRAGDCSKNLELQAGDVVMIPALDHKLNESWPGLSEADRIAFGKCLARTVRIVVKGQTTQLTLVPNGEAIVAPASTNRIFWGYSLNEVVRGANVLLLSSDLTRVKLTRAGGNPSVMVINLDAQPPPGVVLEDGDVIDIPERAN